MALVDKIWAIAQTPGNEQGFTIDLNRMRMCTDEGFCVAYAATQNRHGYDDLRDVVLPHAQGANGSKIIGGWYNNGDNQYYFDSIKVYTTRAAAVTAAKMAEQIGIYDLRTQNYIPIMDAVTGSFNPSLPATRARSHSI